MIKIYILLWWIKLKKNFRNLTYPFYLPPFLSSLARLQTTPHHNQSPKSMRCMKLQCKERVRSSHSEMFYRETVQKTSGKLTGKDLRQSLFFGTIVLASRVQVEQVKQWVDHQIYTHRPYILQAIYTHYVLRILISLLFKPNFMS